MHNEKFTMQNEGQKSQGDFIKSNAGRLFDNFQFSTVNCQFKKGVIMVKSFDIEGSEEFKEAVRDFIEFRKEKKKPLTARGFELFIRKLEKLASDDETKIKIIEQSIENSWTGVFPLHFDVTAGVSSSPTMTPKSKIKPSGFCNFTQKAPDFDAIRKTKRERLMQQMAELKTKGAERIDN